MARDVGEIQIYDLIGEYEDWEGNLHGIGPRTITAQLKALGDVRRIDVRVNSPGGNAMDGIAIRNLLAEHSAPVHVHVDGWAASAASIIAMAGDKIIMKQGSLMMIHCSSDVVFGNADEMRKYAEMMDKFDSQMASIYAAKSGKTPEKMMEMMKAETWLTGAEAVKLGLATDTTDEDAEDPGEEIIARASRVLAYKNAPEKYQRFFVPQSSRIAARYTGRAPLAPTAQTTKEGTDMPKEEPKEGGQPNQAAPAALTAEQVAAQIATAKSEAKNEAKAEFEAELQRRSAIQAKAREFKQEALGEKLIADKTPESQAIIALQTAHIEALTKAAAPNPGPNPPEMEPANPQAKAADDAYASAVAKRKSQMGGK